MMKIWGIHCHPEGPNVPGRSLLEKVENLIQIADRMGIERLGLFLRPGREDEKEIEKVLERHRPRVFGMIWMTLWNDKVQEAALAEEQTASIFAHNALRLLA